MTAEPDKRDDRPSYRFATYNVHRCVGTDRRCDPQRISAVIEEIGADVIGLQEVADTQGLEPESRQFDYLAAATGYKAIAGPNITNHKGRYGNTLLSRLPVTDVRRIDLSVPPFEPRGAILARVQFPGTALRVVVTHLGLRRHERRRQIKRLQKALALAADEPTIFLADFNIWGTEIRQLRRLGLKPFRQRAPASFPSRFPVLALDRILTTPADGASKVRTHASALAKRASDHLPVTATLNPGL